MSAVDSIVTISDVLRPERRVRSNELCHQLLAPRILKNLDDHAARSQELLLAEEGPVLADDDPRDAIEENRASAHGAGRQRGVDRALAIDLRRSAAGVLEGVHLAVQHDASALHAPVVAASEDATVVHKHRADGDPALGQTALGFLDCDSEEFVHVCDLRARIAGPRPDYLIPLTLAVRRPRRRSREHTPRGRRPRSPSRHAQRWRRSREDGPGTTTEVATARGESGRSEITSSLTGRESCRRLKVRTGRPPRW